MKEKGCDYDLVFPNIVQVGDDLELSVEESSEKFEFSKLANTFKDIYDNLDSPNFSPAQRLNNLMKNVVGYTIFSYVFGGFLHDSGKFAFIRFYYNFFDRTLYSD